MGLSFFNAAFLFGTLAAAVPVLIHLIYRRRALVHQFPAMRFLLLADKRTARKFRVHQWLLLALRMAILLLMALSLARPYLVSDEAQAAAALPPQATVILVDNSLSMQYQEQGTSRLHRAQDVVRRLLQGIRPQDRVAVLPLLSSDETLATTPLLHHDMAPVSAIVEALTPSHAAVDLSQAFQQAFTLLQQATTPRRRLVIVSDLTAHGWEKFHLSHLPVLPQDVALHFIRIGTPERDANVAIEQVDIAEQPFIEQAPLALTAVVRNHGAETLRNLRIDLLLGQQNAGQQLVHLRPNERLSVPFRIAAPAAGLHWGSIRLAGDHFAADDHFYFALRTVLPARVLVVDGDPGTSLFNSEIFYLTSALQPQGALGQPLFHLTPVTWEGLAKENLTAYNVIVLCNVETLAPRVRQELYQFVVAGGGVLVFAGNRIDVTRYNTMFYRSDTLLLPAALAAPLTRPSAQPATIQTIDTTHPALQPFAATPTLLEHANIYRYLRLEPSQRPSDFRPLLTLDHGHPLLVEKRVGNGSVMVFTSSADRDWTDLPTRTAYVPLLHGLMTSLAKLGVATVRPHRTLPEPLLVEGRPVDAGATLTVQTPDGQQYPVRYTTDGSAVTARFSKHTGAGIYHVRAPRGTDYVAVNATRTESHFEKLQRDDLQARFQPRAITLEEEADFGTTAVDSAVPAFELAGVLLLALAGVLAVENICANRL
jgi:hypothetical protein